MTQREERRKRNQRVSQALFYDAVADRRRPNYERRGRTTAAPMPDALVARVLQGDTDRRRFEESGTE